MSKTYTLKVKLTDDELWLLCDAIGYEVTRRRQKLFEALEGGKDSNGHIVIPEGPYEEVMECEMLKDKISSAVSTTLLFGGKDA